MIIRGIRIYQLDFLTPGIIPSLAYSRKQMRQSPKSRIKARFLPQRKQRRTMRVENLGFFNARALVEVLAIASLSFSPFQRGDTERFLWSQ